MNQVKNDRGEWVVATGAPNSLKRFECEHPSFIAEVEAYEYDPIFFPTLGMWFIRCVEVYKLDEFEQSLARQIFHF